MSTLTLIPAAVRLMARPDRCSSGWAGAVASSLSEIQSRVAAFRDEGDWEQHHEPKSLVVALMAELCELAEPFLCLTSDESRQLFE